jgi:hypothetical protein
MQRTLEPELLDSLAPHDPNAIHSRRDLRLTNAILGNYRWLVRTLRPLLGEGETALELGAGTGELGRLLARHSIAADGLDRLPRPSEWPATRRWHSTDLRDFAGYADYPVVFGNLIFHHFDAAELAALGKILGQHPRAIVACEPARRKFSQHAFATIAPLLRANAVTLHDARISIAAGFLSDELPLALGLSPEVWSWRCSTTLLGLYRFIAWRRI